MEIFKVSLTSILSAAVLFVMAKFMGHKQLAQLDFFDYITGITIGSIAAELATELEEPTKPLVAIIIYSAIAVCLSVISNKFPKARKYINGTPTIVMDNGKLYRKNMKKARLDLSEFMVMCREQGYFNINDIKTAVFEHDGNLTILPVATKRPLTPDDMKIVPKPENINTELIMDGRILDENLNRIGVDKEWLYEQMHMHGYKNEREIYFAFCDDERETTFFAIE